MTTTATGAANSTSTYTLPSSIKTTTQAKQEQENAVLNGNGGEMGQSAFLTLFTTQLKNQNPLDPMQNEAFVAQLAQFSQLEATTKMSTNLETLVGSLSGQQLSTASSLIGKSVAIPDGKAILNNSEAVSGSVALPTDVDSITLKVYAPDGTLVRTGEIGAQKAGEFAFAWDGKDQNGQQAADGVYRIAATTTKFGKSSTVPVTTMAKVSSVTTDPTTKDMKIQLMDGSTVSMSTIARIGN